jgi:outer membrane protein OmpA-like peptidoglycan-associated protein
MIVTFARNSTRPTPETDEIIRLEALMMTDRPSMKVEVIGHASNDETDWQRISAARAAAVVAILVQAGVDKWRLVARGERSGERSAPVPWARPPAPQSPGDPDAGNVAKEKEAWLAAHRTVEFHVTDPGDPAKNRPPALPEDICKVIGRCAPQ